SSYPPLYPARRNGVGRALGFDAAAFAGERSSVDDAVSEVTALEDIDGAVTNGALLQKRRRNFWIPLSFVFLLLGTLAGFQAAAFYHAGRATGVLQDPYNISLPAAKEEKHLHVRWDRTAPPVRNAQHA